MPQAQIFLKLFRQNLIRNDSRVSREHDDESLRDVELTTTEVPDWDSYDTVLIGYPKMEYSL